MEIVELAVCIPTDANNSATWQKKSTPLLLNVSDEKWDRSYNTVGTAFGSNLVIVVKV